MEYKNIENFLKNCKRPEEYNFEGESSVIETDENFNNISRYTFERYFAFKADYTKPNIYDPTKNKTKELKRRYNAPLKFDCDGSGAGMSQNNLCVLSREVYRTLWGWKDIPEEERNNLEYEIKVNERYGKCDIEKMGFLGPETMNSVQNVMNDTVTRIINKEENEYLRELREGKISFNYSLELLTNENTREKFLKLLYSEENRALVEYIEEYHKIGNSVLVPAYFNPYRALKVKDNWIESLSLLKNKDSMWKYHGNEIDWKRENYNLYINYFFLWDYVDNKNVLPDYSDENLSLYFGDCQHSCRFS